jgi:hypothetical protein
MVESAHNRLSSSFMSLSRFKMAFSPGVKLTDPLLRGCKTDPASGNKDAADEDCEDEDCEDEDCEDEINGT